MQQNFIVENCYEIIDKLPIQNREIMKCTGNVSAISNFRDCLQASYVSS